MTGDTPVPSAKDLYRLGRRIGRQRAAGAVPVEDLWFPPNTPSSFINGVKIGAADPGEPS